MGNATRLQDALISTPTRLPVNLAAVGSIDGSGLMCWWAPTLGRAPPETRLLLQRADPDLACLLEQNGRPTTAEPTLDPVASVTADRPSAVSLRSSR